MEDKCYELKCPFLAYCNQYLNPEILESGNCIFAEQIYFRAKIFEKQQGEKHNG